MIYAPTRSLGRPGTGMLAVIITLVAIASLSMKWLRYTDTDISGRLAAETQIKNVLRDRGFHHIDTVWITSDRALVALIFRKPGCPHDLLISQLGSSGDMLHAVRRYLRGGPVALVLGGQPIDRWASVHAMLANVRAVAGQLLRGTRPMLEPLVAVAPPPAFVTDVDCRWPR